MEHFNIRALVTQDDVQTHKELLQRQGESVVLWVSAAAHSTLGLSDKRLEDSHCRLVLDFLTS